MSALILAGKSAEPRDANTARCDPSQAHDRPRMFAHIEYQVSIAHSPPSSPGADASRSCRTWDFMSEGQPTRTGCEADVRHMCQPLAGCAMFSPEETEGLVGEVSVIERKTLATSFPMPWLFPK